MISHVVNTAAARASVGVLRCGARARFSPLPHWEKAGVRGPQSLNMPRRPHSAPLQREKASAYRWHRKEVTHSLAAAFA